jgi:uncharacterized protein (TIGR02594 family)
MPEMYTPTDFSSFPWMKYALEEHGQREVRGTSSNPRIDAYLRSVGQSGGDETAWCSAFVNWCMEQARIPGTRRANARSWLDWGSADACQRSANYGTVVVLSRGNPRGWQGHVGFYVGHEGQNLVLLGGNQGNAVSIRPYAASRLLGYRLPVGYV